MCVQAQETNALLTLEKIIPLPEIQGGFNHMSADAERHRLFVTATTRKTLEIIDLKSGKTLRSLAGEGSAAALFAPEFNQLYVTRQHHVCFYDGSNFELLTKVDVQCGLDELEYKPAARRLYVGCMTSNNTAIAVISLPDGKLMGEIKLPAKPQGFAVEQKGSRIFVNLPSLKEVTVLDSVNQKVIDAWPLIDVVGNYPMALDESNHRLFVGCRSPAQLLVLDTTTGKTVATVPISADTDDLSYDAAHKRIYIACRKGFLDVIQQLDANHYQSGGHYSTPSGSRNGSLAPGANEYYLAVPANGNREAEIRIYQPQ